MRAIKKSNRGISIMEVVVAILVITIISVATTSLILNSAKKEKANARAMEIASFSESTIESFRFYDNYAEFFNQIKELDVTATEKNGSIVVEKGDYTIAITVDSLYNNILINATDEGGESLYSLSYTRGGGR
ncbi:MAG: hypothetical protein E7382_04630 [Clostridiales bacterium]|nr:hypothetical protein [Clostridiales bacterium]